MWYIPPNLTVRQREETGVITLATQHRKTRAQEAQNGALIFV